MAFLTPQMPLAINIWHNNTLPIIGSPDVETIGNLQFGKHGAFPIGVGSEVLASFLLLPKGTDVRVNDLCEIDSFSERFYQVQYVERSGFGFPNEHVVAVVWQASPFPNNV